MRVYFIKIALHGVSPMIWRRLCVPGTASLAMLHNCIQIINGWDDEHLNQFRIFGRDYGVYHNGGISFNDDANTICIDDFDFEVGDKFTYEYNFFKHILHDIRIEKIKNLPNAKNIISCVSGSGMPGSTKYDATHIELSMLKKILKQKGKVSYADIEEFQENINRVKFNKKSMNKALTALICT